MLYIDDIGEEAISEIKAGKADISAKLLGENSLGVSFPFSDFTKQSGTLHLCFPAKDPNAPMLLIDASNADKKKGKIFQISINNINIGFLRYNASADVANGIFSLIFPCVFTCDLRKDLPLQFDGSFRINFCAKRVQKKPSKLVAAARDLEEQAKRFQLQNNPDAQTQNNDNNNENNDDEIDLNDDKNLNLSLDFIRDGPSYTYYNTFEANGCFSFDFLDAASIKFKFGAATKAIDQSTEPVQEEQKTPATNDQIFEEEEEVQGENEENNQRQEPHALEQAVANNENTDKVPTSLSFYASIEGCIAKSLNFIISTNEEKSTHEISFPIPRTDFSFGLCTSIYNGKSELNSIGASLVYNSKDKLSRVGFAYDTDLGKDNASTSWNIGGGVFRTQLSRMIFTDFNKGEPNPSDRCKWNPPKKDTKNESEETLWEIGLQRFRMFLCSLRENLKDTRVFTLASSLAFDFSNNYTYSKLSEGSFGVSCNIPESIANKAQLQVLAGINQIEDQLAQNQAAFDYSLATRYSWLATEKTSVSLYTKVSKSRLFPSFGVKISYKD